MVTDDKAKRVQRFGPEVWERRAGVDWSLWDLWFCVVAVRDHDGDLDALAEVFVQAIRTPSFGNSEASEAKLSHLHDLHARLDAAGLTTSDLADTDVLADKRIARRARDKVTGRSSLEERACTSAMFDTPRRRLEHRARYGHWSSFPSDPMPFFEKFRPTVERRGFVSKSKGPSIAARLEKRLRELDGPRRTLPDRLALYRAFHTAALELADAADDSYGSIGEVRSAAWDTYLRIDWPATGIDPAAYWQDLCELRLWEPYGLDSKAEAAWFRSARKEDVAIIEAILLTLEAEHRTAVLDHPADEALAALADLFVATRSRDRYATAAQRLGSRAWRPIDAMVRSQLAANDRAGAVAVFKAADQPGRQQDRLRTLCLSLTGIDLADGVDDR
ncbi:MAG: hypothetical protein JJU45_11480 [Acidimicrobiia bacterium]|nr:hypothetical protein [Acidimicrobiia bacterium]